MANKAWRTPSSMVALALLVALLAAAAMVATAEEEQAASTSADAPEAAADEDTTDNGAPAPSPATEVEEASQKKTIGAKAKAGLHSMMEGLSNGKAKLECKVLGKCPASGQ